MLKKLFGLDSKAGSTLIESAFRDVADMLQQSGRMLDHASAALFDNQTLEVDLDSMDDRVDEGERMVRRSVLEHLSFNPEKDLVASLVLVSMVQDAERIGDLARGFTELLPLARSPRQGEISDRLKAVATELRSLFEICSAAFQQDDPAQAQEVVNRATQTKAEIKAIVVDLAASDATADMAVVYCSAARILRRIGGHLSNIASSVVQPFDRIRHGDEEA
jgi:phosphate uptake regulator